MKKYVALAALAALGACSQADEAPPAEPVEAEAAPAATTGEVAPGDYTVTYADGREDPFTLNADGSWTSENAAGAPASGTSTVQDGKVCFVTNPPSEEDQCWTNDPVGADGSFTSTGDDGTKVTVTPVAAAAAPAAAAPAE